MVQAFESDSALSALNQYMQFVRHLPQLTYEEEARLLLCLTSGIDVQQAQTRLVEGYQPLVMNLARRFVRNCRHLELLDLIQEGSEGLLHAIEKYDLSKAVASFRTVAFAWIRGAMLMAYWRDERAIRVPISKVRAIRRMNAVSMQLLTLLGREPAVQEIAQAMETGEREVYELMALQDQKMVSLHLPLEDGETLLEDVLEDTAESPADESSFSVEEVLRVLTEREQMVMRLRYGLVDGRAYTQKDIADRLGIASSRVAVLEHRAKIRLRRAFGDEVA